ncbi:hypothetical protein LUW77_03760 [Streptomyces radiopugnans]|nr:hypothetical protein LUW77_03760 [Streptomyces radiopugnans]
MRVSPATVAVPSGTRLVLEVVNRDAMRHDLRVENGPRTPALGRGESARLDVGTVIADRTAWCTVAGHRAAGMSMRIAVRETGTTSTTGTTGAERGTRRTPATAPAPALPAPELPDRTWPRTSRPAGPPVRPRWRPPAPGAPTG